MTPTCWCGNEATWVVPVDPSITYANRTMGDNMPGLAVCEEHLDKDGYENIAATTEGWN